MQVDKLACRNGVNCSSSGCYFNHPQRVICKFDVKCNKHDCSFNHSVAPCRFKPLCTSKNCPFRHTAAQKGKDGGGKSAGTSNSAKSASGVKHSTLATKPTSAGDKVEIGTQHRIGIFWDIENCPIPKYKSASEVIAHIRNRFVTQRNHQEYEFTIACDTSKLPEKVREDINRAGEVTLAYVSGSIKNAADEKLRERMKIFVQAHGPVAPVLLILISGDIDYVNDLRGYKNRDSVKIIVLHSVNCSRQFRIGWDETYSFEEFCHPVPNMAPPWLRDNGIGAAPMPMAGCSKPRHDSGSQTGSKGSNTKPRYQEFILTVMGLPTHVYYPVLREKLQAHANEVDGKVLFVCNGQAHVSFKSKADANRAIELFSGMIVFGNILTVAYEEDGGSSKGQGRLAEGNGNGSRARTKNSKNQNSIPAPHPHRVGTEVTAQKKEEDSESCSIQ